MGRISINLPDTLETQFRGLVETSGKDGISDFLRELITAKIDEDRFGQKAKEIDLTFLFDHYPLSKIASNPSVKNNYVLIYLLLSQQKIDTSLQEINTSLQELIKQNRRKHRTEKGVNEE